MRLTAVPSLFEQLDSLTAKLDAECHALIESRLREYNDSLRAIQGAEELIGPRIRNQAVPVLRELMAQIGDERETSDNLYWRVENLRVARSELWNMAKAKGLVD